MEEKDCMLALNCMTSISVIKARKLLDRAGGAETLFQMKGKDLFDLSVPVGIQEIDDFDRWRNPEKLDEIKQEMEKKEISYVSYADREFPKRLKHMEVPPIGIFYKGRLPEDEIPSAGLIGSRRCSVYGKETAHFFGKELAEKGIRIISGMALGIDGFSQMGAVSAGCPSYAVLGSGADVCYPRENIALYKNLCENGGVISERPPGYTARPYDFPIRNRLISALSDVILVIESAENSGSMITVNEALKENKEIFALPGRIQDRNSRGCNLLIKNGAQILTSPEDVLQYLGIKVSEDTVLKKKVILDKEEAVIYELLTEEMDMDELLLRSRFSLSVLSGALIRLEMAGLIRKIPGGNYKKV